MIIVRVLAILAALGACTSNTAVHAQSTSRPVIEFDLPIDCQLGSNCFVQNYVDVDPTRRYRDYKCLGLTTNGHKGTDFRLSDRAAMNEGTPVLAAADGIVKGYRDGELDGAYSSQGDEAYSGKACGNAVVIDHGKGWETQYCHLQKDSLDVYRGKAVTAGDQIALVGQSGESEFPHLHFEARYSGKTIDPYTGASALEGCDVEAYTLWTQEAFNVLEYESLQLFNHGFAIEEPTADGVEDGKYRESVPTAGNDELFHFVRVFGLRVGDVQETQILGPDGTEAIKQSTSYNGKTRAFHLEVQAMTRPDTGWAEGSYSGVYKLIRGGRIIIERIAELKSDDVEQQ